VNHKKGATFIFTITLASVDQFSLLHSHSVDELRKCLNKNLSHHLKSAAGLPCENRTFSCTALQLGYLV